MACCGRGNNQVMANIQNRLRVVGIQGTLSPVKLRYLAIAHAPLQITAPSRNVYEVYGGVEFQVAEQDMAWFLSRRDERGRVLYQVVAEPAPVIEIQPIAASFSIEELPSADPLETEDESVTSVKKTRKSKSVE
jgi:hypothetical protein